VLDASSIELTHILTGMRCSRELHSKEVVGESFFWNDQITTAAEIVPDDILAVCSFSCIIRAS
jgi:hypothetical protein